MDEDALLIRRMKQGDEDAIEEFIRKYYPVILRYCHTHISDRGYAEDMTQEVFFRFFRNLSNYRHYAKAANYLYVIAGNCCKDYYKQQREIPTDSLPEEAAEEGLEALMEIRLAVQALPEEFREAAILFFLQERRQRDIAKILGIGLPLVKYRIRRSKELLRGILGKEEKT